MKLKQIVKSKTIDSNVVGIVVAGVLTACGVAIPVWGAIVAYALGNIALRFITKKPLSEK